MMRIILWLCLLGIYTLYLLPFLIIAMIFVKNHDLYIAAGGFMGFAVGYFIYINELTNVDSIKQYFADAGVIGILLYSIVFMTVLLVKILK